MKLKISRFYFTIQNVTPFLKILDTISKFYENDISRRNNIYNKNAKIEIFLINNKQLNILPLKTSENLDKKNVKLTMVYKFSSCSIIMEWDKLTQNI